MSFNPEYGYWLKVIAIVYAGIFFVTQIMWRLIWKGTLTDTINSYLSLRSKEGERVLAEMKTFFLDLLVYSVTPALLLPIPIIKEYYFVSAALFVLLINRFTQGVILTDKALYTTSLMRFFCVKRMKFENIKMWSTGSPIIFTHKRFPYFYSESINGEDFFLAHRAIVRGGDNNGT